MRGLELAGVWGYHSKHWCEVVGGFMWHCWKYLGLDGGNNATGVWGGALDGFWEVVLVGAHGVHLGCSKACQMCCSSHLACLHVLGVHC